MMESAFCDIKWHYDCNLNVNDNSCDCKFLYIVLQRLKKLLHKLIVINELITQKS